SLGHRRAVRSGRSPIGRRRLTAPDRPIPPARAVFGLLVLACLAAFFVTQRLKHTPTAVQRFKMTPSFSPTLAGPAKEESVSFRIAHSDAVTVTIISARGDDVATLVRDYPVVRYKRFSLRWNGRLGVARGYSVV